RARASRRSDPAFLAGNWAGYRRHDARRGFTAPQRSRLSGFASLCGSGSGDQAKWQAESDSHGRALRGLADRNMAMLVSMLKSGTLYDPARRGGAVVAEAS